MLTTSYRDNWERLVAAVVKRDQIRQLCRQDSISTISSDSSQRVLSPGRVSSSPSSDQLKDNDVGKGAAIILLLETLLQFEIGSIIVDKKKMKELQVTLSTIRSLVENDESVSKLNGDAYYVIKDNLDKCITAASILKRKGGNFSYVKKFLFSLKIGRRTKEIA